MAIVDMIDRITDWAEENICKKIRLKVPDDDANDEGYNENYTLVNPSAFAIYVPTKDRAPPGVPGPVPSLCVQLLAGEDTVLESTGKMEIRFVFSAWNPGTHGPDVYRPVGGVFPHEYRQWSDAAAMAYYARLSDGWRDAWNFVDIARAAVEGASAIAGYRIVKGDGIKYGPIEEDEYVTYYPFWFAWMSFSVEYGIRRNIPEYQNFL